jgi:hypothetical protein
VELPVIGCALTPQGSDAVTGAISLENKAKFAALGSVPGRAINQSAMVSALLL